MHVVLRLWPACVLLAAAVLTPRCAGEETALHPTDQVPGAATHGRLADEIEQHWKREILPLWFPRCIDKQHGGFLPNFREDWSPGKQNDKTIVFQSRMTWVAAEVAKRYPELRETYAGHARHGLEFLDRVLWDGHEGGLFWGLDETGKITPRYGGEKHLYGTAFGIYAAANAYQATRDPRALDLAKRTFLWLDRHAHDAAHGGYYEALTRAGKPLLKPPAEKAKTPNARDLLGTPYGYKTMNSHIHLLEALTALYHVWPDAQVEARLREVLEVVRDKIAVEPGCLNLYFTPDWRPVPDHDSFGHDVETAFLLLEAAEALGQPDDPKTLAMVRRLVDHALEWGWDEEHGGFYDKGAAFAWPWGLEKVWWTQAEGLNALLVMHERFGRETPRYHEAFLKQWDFIWKHQVDHRHGEWYESVSAEGKPHPGQDKATVWKAAYHNGRALMNVSAGLRRLAR